MGKKRARIEAPLRPLTAEWRDQVVAALDDLGKTRQWLADQIGTSGPSISNILHPSRQSVSKLVDPISELLDIPPPQFVDNREQEVFELLRQLRDLDPLEFDNEIARIRRLLKLKS